MPNTKREQIKQLILENRTFREIQAELGVSSLTIAECNKELHEEKMELYQCIIDLLLERKEKLRGANAHKKALYDKALLWIQTARDRSQ